MIYKEICRDCESEMLTDKPIKLDENDLNVTFRGKDKEAGNHYPG